jgi:hydroxymethylpyrimidine/phosphomethylpyrimidine kinase
LPLKRPPQPAPVSPPKRSSAAKPRSTGQRGKKSDDFANVRVALSVAGFDPSSGAGVTADLKTFASHGIFGTSAITNLTVQSTQGVEGFEPVSGPFLARTLEYLCADLPPVGIKIGMLGTPDVASAVARFLQSRNNGEAKPLFPIVLDPALKSSSGRELYPSYGLETLHQRLLPQINWITPNWAELAVLAGTPVNSLAQAETAASALAKRHPHLHIVVTGGDAELPTDILRLPSGELHRFPGKRLKTRSTHGTGCAFSSALLCRLVLGDSPVLAIRAAKSFVAESMRLAPGLGHGHGPLDLLWPLGKPKSAKKPAKKR